MSDNLNNTTNQPTNQPTGRKLKIVAVCVGILLLFSVVGNILFFVNTYKPKQLGWQYEVAITNIKSNVEKYSEDEERISYKVTISADIKNLGNTIIAGTLILALRGTYTHTQLGYKGDFSAPVVLKLNEMTKNNKKNVSDFTFINENLTSDVSLGTMSKITFTTNIGFLDKETDIFRLVN